VPPQTKPLLLTGYRSRRPFQRNKGPKGQPPPIPALRICEQFQSCRLPFPISSKPLSQYWKQQTTQCLPNCSKTIVLPVQGASASPLNSRSQRKVRAGLGGGPDCGFIGACLLIWIVRAIRGRTA
jgi:hypothetical protein